MNKKINTIQKNKKRKANVVAADKKIITPLQTFVITILMSSLLIISVSSMITYGSDREPSEDVFNNSQTVQVISP